MKIKTLLCKIGCNSVNIILVLWLLFYISIVGSCRVLHYTKTFDLVSDLSMDGMCDRSGCYNVISFVFSEDGKTAMVKNLPVQIVTRYPNGQNKVKLTIEEFEYWIDIGRGFKSTGGKWIRDDGTIVGTIIRAEIHS
jgi:hypothetical protein